MTELEGYLRAALMRPSRWPGREAYATKDAFCSRCNATEFVRSTDGAGWECRTCHPQETDR
jgi:ribosomal protein L37AE/L43A